MEWNCVAPSCSFTADTGSQFCSVHNGSAIRSRYGSVVYLNGKGETYCYDCNQPQPMINRTTGLLSCGHTP